MKTYPYIGKGVESATVVMMFKPKHGIIIDSKAWATDTGKIESKINEDYFKNITHEHLKNTYGEVVSPRHAEFIIELAKVHDIEVCKPWRKGLFFNFYKKPISGGLALFFFDESKAKSDGEKQITIPLPPKFNKTSEILNPSNADVKLGKPEPLKNAGDNLILGCEQDFKKARAVASDLRKDMGCSDELLAKGDEWKVIEEDVKELDWISRAWAPLESKGDEWPQVGDEVRWDGNDYAGIVKAVSENNAWCRLKNGKYYTIDIERIKKPKTPEEELRDEFKADFMRLVQTHSITELYEELQSKYNITKKPQ